MNISSHLKFKFARISLMVALIGGGAAQADILANLESPVTTRAHWILLSGTGLTLAVIATHSSTWVHFENQTAREKPLGAASKYGDLMGQLVPNALYAGGMWVASYFGAEHASARAVYMVEATLYSAFAGDVLKYAIREPRPNSMARTSFPSGHSTTAFAFAGVVAVEHGWSYGVPAMMLATFVGYSRINDNQHRLQDVIAGATIGLSYAYGIHYVSEEKARQSSFIFLPQPMDGGAGAQLAWRF